MNCRYNGPCDFKYGTNWTKERPTKRGWHIARQYYTDKPSNPFIAYAYKSAGELVIDSGYQKCPIPVKSNFFDNWEWLGPLPE